MNWLRFFRRNKEDAEQAAELEFYLQETAEEYMAAGMDPESAREAARRKLGNVTQIREEVYGMNTLTWLEGVARDARHALRVVRMNPGFSLAAILSLALGIGANVAIFSVVNGVLIRPLPYPDPERLAGVFNSGVIQGQTFPNMGLGPAMYAGLKEHARAFDEVGVWLAGTATVTGLGAPEQIKTVTMTEGVLAVLGGNPYLGRRFSQEDDSPGTQETAILSHAYWMRAFGGDTRVLGRTLVIDFVPRRVIGVMPQTFQFLDRTPDVFLPQRFARENLPYEPFSWSGMARLKRGVSIAAANEDAARVLSLALPENARKFAAETRLRPNLRPLKQDVTGDVGTVLGVLMGALGLVLLLVCANVANLVLTRAQARHQEFAIRAALGAGWTRIARELLVESLTLGLLGGTLGMALAYGSVHILKSGPVTGIPRLQAVSIDGVTLAFGLACSVAGSLLFGLVAVFQCAIPGRSWSARGASASADQVRAQNTLVVAQVSLALVLLIASGLLIRTLVAMRGVHPGFTHPERVQTVGIAIPATQAPDAEKVARMQAEMVARVRQLPGVEAAAFADAVPMDPDRRNGNLLAVEDKFVPGQPPPNRRVKHVSPGLFAAQGTRLLAGRDFSWDDLAQRRRVAIVSESMARENWGEARKALGKRLRPGAQGDQWLEVVGVVEDVYDDGAHRTAPPIVYFRTGVHDAWQPNRPATIRRGLTMLIRSSRANTESFLKEVAAAIHAVDSSLPLAQVRTLDDIYRRSMARTSFALVLLAVSGTMALALAVIGIYGVVAYAVGRRRREVGIRIALGARPSEVTGLFLRRGIVLVCWGCVVGTAAAMGLSRWVSSLLYGVTALDPATYAGAALTVAAAALIASYVPARRASAADPKEALRAE